MRPAPTARPAPPLARRLSPALLVLALAAGVVPARAAPMLFPATPSGPEQWRDERDTAPFLAAWKASQLSRARAFSAQFTANQAAYDVRTYDLDLTLSPVAQLVSGTVRTRATVLAGPISTLDLDLAANMVVDGATAGGVATTSTRSGDLLTLALDRAYATGELVDVTVTYHGLPLTGGAFGGAFGFSPANGRTLIWSLSEPYGARTWWPCKDTPADKADSVDIRFTVPTGMVTASNGTRLSATDNGTVAVTHWKERHPIATYLVSIASYPYATSTDWYRPTPADSMPIQFYNFPESVAGVTAVQAKVKDMIAAYAARYGEYPFVDEKYGHAEFLFGGGMEHQTCTSLGAFGEYVVAHELGHQWWGDHVTCGDFHHVWLNEGFATYSEAIWAEANGGLAAYQGDLALNRYFGAGSIYVADTTSVNRIFDSNLSYNKASWVLHMLRHVLGDATFFAALRQYGGQYAYASATTENFRDACEAASGRDLHAFFQQWIYGEYYPVYRPTWVSAAAAGGFDVTLTLEQTQPWQLFRMPVDVRVTTTAGVQSFVVEDSLASQAFTLHVDATPTALAVDPDEWILRKVDVPVVNPPFDRSVLVVNGVDWATYGTEITSAYTDHAFSGDYVIDFWDVFATPGGGYPAALPAPLGHGAVPPDVLGHYRNVIWLGNNFNGDLEAWGATPALSYLRAGGNLMLMSRQGTLFLTDSLLAYAGIAFTSAASTLQDCIATRPGLGSLPILASQSLCAVFDSARTRTDTQLLFKAQLGFNPPRGIGVLRQPVGGMGTRPAGGRFIFLSGRPYRWNHAQLRADVSTMLAQYFLEPYYALGVGADAGPAAVLTLSAAAPNPFTGTTTLRCTLGRSGPVEAEVLDLAGRRVRTLHSGVLPAGTHALSWDGLDREGHAAGAGIYWVRVRTEGASSRRRIVRLP